MTITISSRGQVTLPKSLRQKLNLQTGDRLEMQVQENRIILIPVRPRRRKAIFKKDPVTGMSVLSTGGPTITSEMVYTALEDFP